MRIAITHSRPGISSPPGALIAVAMMGVMGLYGFTTALQKSVADRRDSIDAVRGGEDSVRLASAIAATPSLVYAVNDGPVQPAPVVRRAPAPLPEPVIDEQPTPVNLVAVAAVEPVATTPVVAENAAAAAVNASATEPAPPAAAVQP